MNELDKFKREINIAEFAQSFGYEIDRKKSTKNAPVLKNANGDKIVVGIDPRDNHYRYFNPSDDSDRGSIIDFVQNRTGESLGHIRKRLRSWLNMPDPQIERVQVTPATIDVVEAKIKSRELWEEIGESRVMINLRGVGFDRLESARDHKIKYDGEKYYFKLTDGDGEIVGVETRDKNGRNARLGKGHKKGIFTFGNYDNPDAIVIAESTIDALSVAELANGDNLYLSLGGNSGRVGDEALRRFLERAPSAPILIATDNDEAGDRHAKHIAQIVVGAVGEEVEISRARPISKDWNDDLMEKIAKEEEEAQSHSYSYGYGMSP